jgi:quercetin dioxygenase-like cupin family protein
MSGVLLPPGAGRRIVTPAQQVTFKVTGADGSVASVFEVVVPPGFDVGAHVHDHAQELFYVLDGELDLLAFEPVERTDSWADWESAAGDRVARAGAGSCMFVPPGVPHAFRNSSDRPATMLFQQHPAPDHERYFEEIAELWASGRPDPEAVRRMRGRYDVQQITPLSFRPPALAGHENGKGAR